MIKDEDLKSSIDYSAGQKEAAHRILVELVNIFREYENDIRIIGGWVPDLMFPGEGHIGSVDVDVLINHLTLHDEGYQNMERILQRSGYKEHPDKYFSFVKTVEAQLHAKLQRGYDDYKAGRTHNAVEAFAKFREHQMYISDYRSDIRNHRPF